MHDHTTDPTARHHTTSPDRGTDSPRAEPLRLLCDEMLRGLGRWLRAAGYNTAIAHAGQADGELLRRAGAEVRVLLTRDRELAARAGLDVGVVALATESLDAGARELGLRLGIDWLFAPFTRCLLDNAVLLPASAQERLGLPFKARGLEGPINTCPDCARLYWPGSHVCRMRARLEAWQGPAMATSRSRRSSPRPAYVTHRWPSHPNVGCLVKTGRRSETS
ncbi:MAG: Mut7-C RNAse domain-containing protein [Kiloniellales bacterium]